MLNYLSIYVKYLASFFIYAKKMFTRCIFTAPAGAARARGFTARLLEQTPRAAPNQFLARGAFGACWRCSKAVHACKEVFLSYGHLSPACRKRNGKELRLEGKWKAGCRAPWTATAAAVFGMDPSREAAATNRTAGRRLPARLRAGGA